MNTPHLDLSLERTVDLSPDELWTAWTQPEHLMPWFTPAPWVTVACTLDVRPGGEFSTLMRSPDGGDFPNTGCYLEVVPGRRLVWTDALEAGYRPSRAAPHLPFRFTATLQFEPHPLGARYLATVQHATEDARRQHEEMGFHGGWGQALDQLVAYMKGLRT